MDHSLTELATLFAQLRARWARQGRRVRQLSVKADEIVTERPRGRVRGRRRLLNKAREEVGHHAAWARWSATADELEVVVKQVLNHPTGTVRDLSVKFDALAWLLLADGAVVDHVAERELRKFRRELHRLA